MIDNYTIFLKNLEKKHPKIYIKIYKLPQASIKGIINNFFQNGYKIDNTSHIKKFFDNQPYLKEYTEIEFIQK